VQDNGLVQRAILGGKKKILRHIERSSDLWTARTLSCAEDLVIVTCATVRTVTGRTR
jgi:hypothetical protein